MGVGTLTFLHKKPYGIDYTLYTLTKGQIVSSMITVTSTVTNNKKRVAIKMMKFYFQQRDN